MSDRDIVRTKVAALKYRVTRHATLRYVIKIAPQVLAAMLEANEIEAFRRGRLG